MDTMENVRPVVRSAPNTPSTSPTPQEPVDLVRLDYVEELGSRLEVVESELQHAWRALAILSQEYTRIWERLERLEDMLCDQQSVISQLIKFYSSVDSTQSQAVESSLAELGIRPSREIRYGAGAITSGQSSSDVIISEMDLDMGSDEAFYRSLNNAYRDDLICPCPSSSVPGSSAPQLGMIWEESEEDSNGNGKRSKTKRDNQDVFTALDYREYRGNSPCVSEQDLEQASQLSAIDQAALQKLRELDSLSTKLKKDSQNLKKIQNSFLALHNKEITQQSNSEYIVSEPDADFIANQLRRLYSSDNESNSWNFRGTGSNSSSSHHRTLPDIPLLGKHSDTDDSLSSYVRNISSTPTSPRKYIHPDSPAVSRKYASTGRLHVSSSLNSDLSASRRSLPLSPKSSSFVLTDTVTSRLSPSLFTNSNDSTSATDQTVMIRTRQDGYIGSNENLAIDMSSSQQTYRASGSNSPPPPAPQDSTNTLYIPQNDLRGDAFNRLSPVAMYDSTGARSTSVTSLSSENQGHLSPHNVHSPKSPRGSPKQLQSSSSNIVTPKSDSGFYSLSGWSSMEKSPVSPKSGGYATKNPTSYASENLIHIGRISQQHPIASTRVHSHSPRSSRTCDTNANLYYDSELSDAQDLLPGGHRTSSFTTVRTPTSLHDSVNNFVPPPAPSESSLQLRRPYDYSETNQRISSHQPDFLYHRDEATIYSVAGSNRPHDFTSVYTSGASFLPSTTVSAVPDLIGPHTRHKDYIQQRSHSTSSYSSPGHSSKKSLTRVHSTGSVPSTTPVNSSVTNLEGYKTAMYRTMFPTGKITDALTYYPTGNTYTPAHGGHYSTDPTPWKVDDRSQMVRDTTASTIRSSSSETTYGAQRWCEPRYYSVTTKDLSYNDGWVDRSAESYVENRGRGNIPELIPTQVQNSTKYYDPSSVIVSQSGYISIAADIKEPSEEKTKKPKRVGSLKAAMNSVSNWLPDLHLPKRHRSYSLPSGVRKEDLIMSKESGKVYSSNVKGSGIQRKKKKLPLVSTMSGILQKAKWRSQNSSYAMSDPECQSESEWGGRSAYDDSEDSVFSDAQSEVSNFSKMSQRTAPPLFSTVSIQPQAQQSQLQLQKRDQEVSSYQQQLHQQQQQIPMQIQQQHQYQQQQQQIQHNVQLQQMQQIQYQQQLHLQQQRQYRQQEELYQQQALVQQQQLQLQQQQLIQQQQHHYQQQQQLQMQQQQQEQQHGLEQQKQKEEEQQHQQQLQQQQHLTAQNEEQMELDDSQISKMQTSTPQTRESQIEDEPSDIEKKEFYDDDDDEPPLSASLFMTVGDLKKSSLSSTSDDQASDDNMHFPPVTLGSASREFAVSRALGKYRRRQSASTSDDLSADDTITSRHEESLPIITRDEEEEEMRRNEIFEKINSEESKKMMQSNLQLEEQYVQDGLINSQSKNHSITARQHMPPRHQQSLEIPWGGRGSGDTDDDNRSTHSWRSTSRVSSRRQSTEDSIDSEDEWYCYELRKLEELERQSIVESERRQEEEKHRYEPDDETRVQMSSVLQELKMKVRQTESIQEQRRPSVELRRQQSLQRRPSLEQQIQQSQGLQQRRPSSELDQLQQQQQRRASIERRLSEERRSSFDKYNDEDRRPSIERMPTMNQRRASLEKVLEDHRRASIAAELEKKERKREPEQEDSSGETSGPDSPNQSAEELETEEVIQEELEMMRRSSSGSTMKTNKEGGTVSREGSVSVPPSEMSISLAEGWDSEETATVREGPASEEDQGPPGTPSLPRFKFPPAETFPSVSEEESTTQTPKDSKDAGGPLGSKWKLLKALKERKAEEKCQEAEKAAAATSATTTVSDEYLKTSCTEKTVPVRIKFL
ncbi:uncharacterized protein LOC142318519 [Lycorma delicatula]|uniref:uncharacterized protein LOC142318519 n=1 Tax=Lycorma delicatula TaxID=130591 RepID=UPI003F519084